MFDVNNNNRLADLHRRNTGSYLLIREKYLTTDQPAYERWWVLLASIILLAGLSGPLQALPKNAQSGDVESSIDQDFLPTAPITLSKLMTVSHRSEVSNAHRGQAEYDLDSDVGRAAAKPGYDSLTDTTLTWESGNASRGVREESRVEVLGVPKLTRAAVIQSGTTRLASDNDAVSTSSEDSVLEVKMPLRGGHTPYATITLAVLAVLGLVSVARRDDIG